MSRTSDTFLNPFSYHLLPIKYEKLELNNDGTYAQPELSPCFFEPRSPALLHGYPLGFEEKAPWYRYIYESFDGKIESYRKGVSNSSIGLCKGLNRVFYSYPRCGINPGKNGLSYFKSWHRSGYLYNPLRFECEWLMSVVVISEKTSLCLACVLAFLFHSHNPHWQAESAYVSRNPEYPHVMLIVRHEVEPEVTGLLREKPWPCLGISLAERVQQQQQQQQQKQPERRMSTKSRHARLLYPQRRKMAKGE